MNTPYTPEQAGSGQYGICVKCNKGPTPEGHDGCVGMLPPSIVMNACCGHGRDSMAYIQYWDGTIETHRVSGKKAIKQIKQLKRNAGCL